MPQNARGQLVMVVVLIASSAPAEAFAQAWVGASRQGEIGVGYDFITSDVIVEEDGDEFAGYPIVNHNLVLSAGYNPIDSLGLSLSVPYVFVRYEEQAGSAFPPHGEYDDGDFHGTLQDLRFRVRYQLPIEAFALSPHVGGQIPLADYEVFGFANAGRGLKGALAGASLGWIFLERFFAHGVYEFGIFEKSDESDFHDDYQQLRSDLNTTFGAFITSDIELHLGLDLHWTHDGLAYTQLPPDPAHPLYGGHDPILDEDWIHAGLGGSWSLGESIVLGAEFRRAVATFNAREITSLSVSLGYDFGI